ncbi:MAG: hypothetical protein COC06_05500 [Bacteroidales bacterium]|nr:MAG: hypothetical protein COC06_05500 [Bacteroidales bacterium]
MFGLSHISWTYFLHFLFFSLLSWYAGLILLAWMKSRINQPHTHYEDMEDDEFQTEKFQSIYVSAKNFPSDLTTSLPASAIPLGTSFYEETGMDEGYAIEDFWENSESRLPTFLDQVQYQQ